MKNVIMIICDSLKYDEYFWGEMPFLNKIKSNCIIYNNYHAKAPYTEAALVSLFTGTDTIDYGGYIQNIKYKPITINEIFKENKFKTFNTTYFYPNTKSVIRGVDEYTYVDFYPIGYSILVYRIKYFRQLYFYNNMSENHYNELKELLEDFWEMNNIYKVDYKEKKYRFDILNENTNFIEFDFLKFQEKIHLEILEFKLNPNKYMNKILAENCIFDEFNMVLRNNKVDEKYEKELNKLIKASALKQFLSALKFSKKNNSIPVLKNILKEKKSLTGLKKAMKTIINNPIEYKENKMISANLLLNHTFSYLCNNKNEKNFIICHLMDNHYPFNYINKENIEDKDIKDIKKYIRNYDWNKGNIFYNLSKNYVDKSIENFIGNLEEEGILDDTSIIITADHGSSYSGTMYRENQVCNFYEENYKIPFIIYEKKLVGEINNNLGSAVDFIPTIASHLNMKIDKNILKGIDLGKEGNESIIYEYLGAGCPDNIMNDKLLCIKDNNYKVLYRHKIGTKFDKKNIYGIYNLKEDVNESKNLNFELKESKEIKKLVQNLEKKIINIEGKKYAKIFI